MKLISKYIAYNPTLDLYLGWDAESNIIWAGVKNELIYFSDYDIITLTQIGGSSAYRGDMVKAYVTNVNDGVGLEDMLFVPVLVTGFGWCQSFDFVNSFMLKDYG